MEKVSDNFLEAKKYADDLVSGKKLANIEQVQAAQRFIDDLKSDKWDFRSDQFDFVISLIEGTIKHQQGQDLDGGITPAGAGKSSRLWEKVFQM